MSPLGALPLPKQEVSPTSFVHVMQSSAQLWWCVPLCLPGNDVGTGKRAPEPCPRPPPSSPWRRRGGQWPANLISYFIIPFVQFSAKANLPFYNTLSMLDLNWSLMQTALCLWNWGRVLWCWLRRVMMMMMTNSDDDDDDDGDDGDLDDGDDAGDILWCPFLFCSSPLGTLEPTSSSSKQTLCLPRMCYSVIIYSRFFTLRSSQNTLIRQQWLCILYYALQSGGGQWLKAKGRWQKGGSGWGATVASHLKGHQCPMKSSILLAVAHKEQPMQYS